MLLSRASLHAGLCWGVCGCRGLALNFEKVSGVSSANSSRPDPPPILTLPSLCIPEVQLLKGSCPDSGSYPTAIHSTYHTPPLHPTLLEYAGVYLNKCRMAYDCRYPNIPKQRGVVTRQTTVPAPLAPFSTSCADIFAKKLHSPG